MTFLANKKVNRLIEDYSKMLYEAQNSKVPIGQISIIDPSLTIEDAYKIQMINIERRLSNGEVICGKKIGLTSLAMQNMLGVSQPDYGHLFKGMEIKDNLIPTDSLLQPKIEAEVAFVLKNDLKGPNVTVNDVLDATDYVVAAFEIVDSRVKDWKINIIDTVADNASSGCYCLGSKKLKVSEISLPEIEMSLYKDGKFVNSGTGKDVLGDPAYCVAWLANKMSEFGVTLYSGEVVLSGALSAAPIAKKGDKFEARFSHLGNITAKFV